MLRAIFNILVISISMLFLVKCDNYEFPKSPYPRLETLNVTNISTTGVSFRGNLVQLGDKPIIDHGFVWGFEKNITLETANEGILRLGTTSSVGEFQGDVFSGLFKDKTYYVRAFVNTEAYKVYGDPVAFISNGSTPPKIDKFEPLIGTWGDTVTIHGSFFSTTLKSNIVRFGSLEAKVIEANETTIICIVPDNIETLVVPLSVKVGDNTAQAANTFQLTVPIIDDFTPTSGTFLDEVIITGSNFGINPEKHRVSFGGHPAEVVGASRTSLRVKVPTEVVLKTNEIRVVYNLQTAIASSSFNMMAPTITSLSKEEGLIGDEIELIGDNFNPRLLGNEVWFGENLATVVSATGQSIRVKVPKGIYPERNCTVKITVAEQTATNSNLFKLLDAWLKKGYTPTAEHGDGGFKINGTGYFVAGNYLYAYNPSTNNWTRKADFPGVFRFDQHSFEAGGFGYSGLGALGCCPGGSLIDLWRYSPSTDSWLQRSNFPIDTYGVLATGLGTKGYAVDGTINMFEYDPGSNLWQVIGDPLDANFTGYPHFQNSVFTMDNRLFVFLRHEYNPVPNYLYEFDIASGSWIRRAELIEDRMSGFEINGTGYIKGFKSIHKYNFTTNQLTLDISPLAEGYWGMIYLFTINDKAYVLGNWANSQFEFWEFDPAYL